MNAENERQPNPPEETTTSAPYGKLVVISGVIFGMLTYFVIRGMTQPPPLPEIDFNRNWGPDDQNNDTSIKQIEFGIPDEVIGDLKERLLHTRKLSLPIENSGFTYGFNSQFLNQVIDFWRNKYDFKERERFFNKYPHFVTKIQGLDIHYLHVKSDSDNYDIVPILLLHGWPGTFRDFYDVITELITPKQGKNFAFEVVVPSLPGFGLSQSTRKPGLDVLEVAVIMNNLMKRLGFKQYYVHGGQMGHLIGAAMATAFPDSVLGFHTNTPLISNPSSFIYIWCGAIWPSLIEPNEGLVTRIYPIKSHLSNVIQDSGYFHIQATRPDTIGLALEDSPAGLAAYILDIYAIGTNPKNKLAYDGQIPNYFYLTNLLDNILVFWATHSITSSMRLYAETFSSKLSSIVIDRIPTEVPTAGIKFKHDISYQPDNVLRLKYKNYLRSTIVDTGGRFPAMEHPALLAMDIIEAVELFIEYNHLKDLKTQPAPPSPKSVYDFTVNDINGIPVQLDKYKGKVLIIVNVASQCGLTETNYKELNELYEKFYHAGLRILAFPCNQFNGQEPGTSKEIMKFAKNKGVQFDLFAKVEVNGEHASPLWKFLKAKLSGILGEFIKWNFSKFIIDKNGNPVERFGPNINPKEMEPYVVKYLFT